MSTRLAPDARLVISEIPSSSRAWAPRHLSPSAAWQLVRARRFDTALDVDFGKLFPLELDIFTQLLAFACKIRLFGVGLRADGHILACSHRHGAGNQSRDTGDQDIICVAAAAATPTIKLAVETMPSLAPSTAARTTRFGRPCGFRDVVEGASSDTLREIGKG